MKYAFFDVDNTLYNGYTASDILEYMKDRSPKHMGFLKRIRDAEQEYMLRRMNYNQIAQLTLDLNSKALQGLTVMEVKEIVLALLDQKKQIFNDWVSDTLKYLKNHDFKIILISAGADVMVEELALMIQADQWFATKIEHNNNIYTGAKTDLLNEHRKTEIIRGILKKDPSELSVGFGDSTGDIPLLENVDYPFVVMNDHHSLMIKYARDKKWNIFRTSNEVIEKLQHLL